MNNVIIPYIVPVLAATLVVKAILDTAEGNSPLPSTIAALFLLGVQGFFNLAVTWNDGTNLATVDLLEQMFVYFATVVCPTVGHSRSVAPCFPTSETGHGHRWFSPASRFCVCPVSGL